MEIDRFHSALSAAKGDGVSLPGPEEGEPRIVTWHECAGLDGGSDLVHLILGAVRVGFAVDRLPTIVRGA